MEIKMYNKCPKCDYNFDGGSILETFLKQRDNGVECWQGKTDEEIEEYMKEFYGPPFRWSTRIAVEIQGTDRTDYYICPNCKEKFERK